MGTVTTSEKGYRYLGSPIFKVEQKEQSNNIYEIQISYVKGRRSAARAWRIAQRGERPEEVMGGKPPSRLMAWWVLTKKRKRQK